MIMIWAIVSARLIAWVSYIAIYFFTVYSSDNSSMLPLPLFVSLVLLARISVLTGLMSTRTTLLSTDFLAMYGLNIQYEIHL